MVFIGRESLYKVTVPMLGETNVGDVVFTLAVRCALKMLKDCIDEHDITKRLLIEHL